MMKTNLANLSSIPLYETLAIEDGDSLQSVESFTNLIWPHGNQLFRTVGVEAGQDAVIRALLFEGAMEQVHPYSDASHLDQASPEMEKRIVAVFFTKVSLSPNGPNPGTSATPVTKKAPKYY